MQIYVYMYMCGMFPTKNKLNTTNKKEHKWNDVHNGISNINIAFYNAIF